MLAEMERRDEFEAALRALLGLLDSGEAEEVAYQRFLENHPIAWQSLGYGRAIPHPTLRLSNGRLLIPDFIAENGAGLAELIDLKRPTMRLMVRSGEPRARVSAAVHDAVTQLEDYSAFFRDEDSRRAIENEHDITIPPTPDLVLVGGLSQHDASELHESTRKFSSTVRVLTYDQVASAIQSRFVEEFPASDRLAYFGFTAMLQLKRWPDGMTDAYLFDHGLRRDADRISLGVDPLGRLWFTVIGSDGRSCSVRSRDPLECNEWLSLWFELTVTDMALTMNIRVGAQTVGRQETWEPFELDERLLDGRMTMGTDVDGERGAAFRLNFYGIVTEPVPLDQLGRLGNWAEQRAGDPAGVKVVDFEEHQFLERGDLL